MASGDYVTEGGLDGALASVAAATNTRLKSARLPQNWAFFGDSITNIGEGYPFYAQVKSGGRIIAQYVQSNPGQDSAYLLGVIDAQVINQSPRPGACLLLCGANDAQSAVTIAAFKSNVQQMISKLRAAGIRPVIGTVPPNNNGTADILVRTYNAWLSRWASTSGVPLVDFYGAVSGSTGWLAAYDSGDGLHPSAAGNAALGQAVIDAVGDMLSSGEYIVQPRDGDPNMQVNGTFNADTNSDGIPDGLWTNATTVSLVPDAGGLFKWARITINGQAARNALNSDELTVADGDFAVGDVLRFSALVRTGQNTTQNKAGLEMHVTCFNDAYAVMGDFILASWNGGLSQQVNGSIVREFTVPAGTTRIVWNMIAGPQDGTYDVALPTFVNLTAKGCL